MKLSRSHAAVVKRAVNKWVEEGALTEEQASKLDESIEIQKFDWQGLSSYAFYGALFCFVIAIVAIFSGNFFYKLVQRLLDAPDSIFALFFTVATLGLFIWGKRFRTSVMRINAEIVLVLTMTLWGIALFFWNKALGWNTSMLAFVLILWSIPAFLFSSMFRSLLQWCLAVVALFFALLFLFDLMADSQLIFHHLNYSLRATLSAVLLMGGALIIKRLPNFLQFYPITFSVSLIALMFSLWILSISGNTMNYEEWRGISQWHFWPWIIIFTIAGGIALWRGLKNDDDLLKGVGITALLLDIYTRYFEFFWDTLHKALFFLLLAVSLWIVSRRAEQMARKNKQNSFKFFNFSFKQHDEKLD